MQKKKTEFRDRVHELLGRDKTKPLSPGEIAAALQLRGKERKQLQSVLHELVKDGAVAPIRHNRYALGSEADLVTGRLSVARSGKGFVKGAIGEVIIPSDEQGTAMPEDLVLVRLDGGGRAAAGQERTGKIIKVLERGRRDIVGTLQATGQFQYVVPLNPVYRQNVYVGDAKDAKVGDRVVVRLGEWVNKRVSPEGEIVEVIGPADNPTLDTVSIMRQYGYPDAFPDEVLAEAETVANLAEHPGVREDLRDRLVVTIDPERARDFDDALSLERDAQGNTVLGVHIADVSHFVRPGSSLDREAASRGNSVYLPDRVIPMLPEQLSNGICSLNPDRDRLAFSAFLTLNDKGAIVGRRFARTLIRSRHRFTYEAVMAFLAGGAAGRRTGSLDEPTAGLLFALDALAQRFRARRFRQFALDLDMPECEVVMGPDGMIKELRVVPNDRSHQLVEECMLAANEAVAGELRRRGVPLISRIHEPPDEEKLEFLAADLAALGYEPGDLSDRAAMARFLDKTRKDPLAAHVRVAVLRSLKRAMYATGKSGHYGLAKTDYAHFTSPIRRYPDLVVHRQLAALLADKPTLSADRLGGVADHCTQTEWKADEAERAVVEIKKFRFLEQALRRGADIEFDGVVVRVTNFGLFVELDDLQLTGLVHISTISERLVTYDPNRKSLRSGRQIFKVGQKVRVRVAKVDFNARRVDFLLV